MQAWCMNERAGERANESEVKYCCLAPLVCYGHMRGTAQHAGVGADTRLLRGSWHANVPSRLGGRRPTNYATPQFWAPSAGRRGENPVVIVIMMWLHIFGSDGGLRTRRRQPAATAVPVSLVAEARWDARGGDAGFRLAVPVPTGVVGPAGQESASAVSRCPKRATADISP